MYYIYRITYSGDKLPLKFVSSISPPTMYIGKCLTSKFDKGYHGSVSSKLYKNIWKQEVENNRDLFFREILSSSKNNTEATRLESRILTYLNAAASPDYVNFCNGYEKFSKMTPHSEIQKHQISESNKQTWSEKTTEEMKLFKLRNSMSNLFVWNQKTERERDNYSEIRSILSTEMWENKTEGQINFEMTSLGKARDEARGKRTEEEKQIILDKSRKVPRNYHPVLKEMYSSGLSTDFIWKWYTKESGIKVCSRTIRRICL